MVSKPDTPQTPLAPSWQRPERRKWRSLGQRSLNLGRFLLRNVPDRIMDFGRLLVGQEVLKRRDVSCVRMNSNTVGVQQRQSCGETSAMSSDSVLGERGGVVEKLCVNVEALIVRIRFWGIF